MPWSRLLLLALCACRVWPDEPVEEEPVDTGAPVDTEPVEPEGPTWSDSERTVLLVSLDGFRWDYRGLVETPTLDRLVAEGVTADALVPVFPTKTFPNHFTQVTGLYPSEHGIVDNAFWDPEVGQMFSMEDTEWWWWGGEPIWITAAKQYRKAVTVFWPGSETSYGGWRPHHWLRYDGSLENSARVAQLLEWLDEPQRPHLGTLYFSDVDHAGHTYGPDSVEVLDAIRKVDADLGLLISGLEERDLLDAVDLVVVSDHGMRQLSRDRAVFLDDHLDVDDYYVTAWNAYTPIDPKTRPVADVLADLADLDAACTSEDTRPEDLHFTGNVRIPPILCLAEPGWALTTHAWHDANPTDLTGATHGWHPSDPEMHGIFIARGPHLKQGTHPAFSSVHLYELLAALLEIEPAPNSGDPTVTADLLVE